jgi:hypothetical protein
VPCINLSLPTLVAAGQGEQNGPTAWVDGLDPIQRQKVLHPKPRSGAVELRGHRTGGRPEISRQRPGVLAGDLVGQERTLFTLRQARQRCGDGILLLPPHDPFVRKFRRPQVQDPMPIAPMPVLLLPHRRDHVRRGHDGVRLEHARLDAIRGRENPH